MKKMFEVNKFLLFLIGLFLVNFAFADDLSSDDLWQQATASTRDSAAAINNQIMEQQAEQAAVQNQQQQQMQQTLQAIQLQEKAMLYNQTPQPTTSSTFQAKPSTVTGTTSPWDKPNPWQNTTQNPYAGQQYSPNPAPTPAVNVQPGPIYVNPNALPTPQQQNSNPVNIYK